MAKKSQKATKKSVYSVHPAVAMVQKWVAELPQKTGRSLEQWIEHVQKDGPDDEKERRTWLREKYGLGTNTAWWIAEYATGGDMGIGNHDPDVYLATAEGYVEAMFAGPKAVLRPIYDELLKMGFALGADVRVCPCKTIVPFYRNHVIAEVKPATRTRIDFGFALGDTPLSGRLIDTGGLAKKNRITHRIPLASVDDIDDEVQHWLQTAYERDGEKS
jgi:hypothetical protein